MISVQDWIRDSSVPARMIMQVHDELVFEVAEAEAATLQDEIVARMAQAADLSVPLKVDAGRGRNWDEAH
jgi:DNA polymerase-1